MRAWEPLLFSRQLQLCWTQFKWPFCMLDDNTIEIQEWICLHHETIPLLFKVQLKSRSHHIFFAQNFSIFPLEQLKVQMILIQFAEYFIWHFSKNFRHLLNFLHSLLKRIVFRIKGRADPAQYSVFLTYFYIQMLRASQYLKCVYTFQLWSILSRDLHVSMPFCIPFQRPSNWTFL